jgi:hypothetical protein
LSKSESPANKACKRSPLKNKSLRPSNCEPSKLLFPKIASLSALSATVSSTLAGQFERNYSNPKWVVRNKSL